MGGSGGEAAAGDNEHAQRADEVVYRLHMLGCGLVVSLTFHSTGCVDKEGERSSSATARGGAALHRSQDTYELNQALKRVGP